MMMFLEIKSGFQFVLIAECHLPFMEKKKLLQDRNFNGVADTYSSRSMEVFGEVKGKKPVLRTESSKLDWVG